MTEATDLFMQPTRGGGVKPEDMEGKLVLFHPTSLGKGPKYMQPGETTDRITSDVVVFAEDGSVEEEVSDAYFSQAGLLPPLKACLKPGALPYVLGRIRKYPAKSWADKGFDTPEKIQAALDEWLKKGGKGEKPQFAWSIAEFTDEDAAVARRYLASKDPFAAPAS